MAWFGKQAAKVRELEERHANVSLRLTRLQRVVDGLEGENKKLRDLLKCKVQIAAGERLTVWQDGGRAVKEYAVLAGDWVYCMTSFDGDVRVIVQSADNAKTVAVFDKAAGFMVEGRTAGESSPGDR